MLTTTQPHNLCTMQKTKKATFKRFIAMFALMLIVFTLVATITPTANAWIEEIDAEDLAEWKNYRNLIYDKLGGFGGVCWDVASTAAGCNPNFNLATIAGEIYKISNYSGKWTLGGLSSEYSLIGAGKQMYDYMKVVGICLIFLYFLIDLLDEVQADSFTIEHLIKKLLTLTIAIVVLTIGGEIFDYICQLGDALIQDAKGAVSNGADGEMRTLYESIIGVDDGGFFSNLLACITMLGIIAENLIPYILTFVVYLIAYLVSFSRFIEILVRFAFAPIGMAQLVSGGAKGPGMRYIKKFASCVLQGAVCTLSFGTVSIIQSTSNELNAFFASILVPITLIGFLMKAGRIADDICGV